MTGSCPLVGRNVSFLWGELYQDMCLLGHCMVRKTLSSLSADGWGSVAILLIFLGSRHPRTGTYRLFDGARSW